MSLIAGEGETIDGEPVLLTAELDPSTWKQFRTTTCCLISAFALPGAGLFLCGIPYALCGGSCRDAEMESFELKVTPTAIHLRQKTYIFGLCCQTTTRKSVPLDKVQDISLHSDCCGDCCGWSREAGHPYRISIQTAGGASAQTGMPELLIACLRDPEEFRTRVLHAKRELIGAGGAAEPLGAGSGKGAAAASGSAVAVLTRIEGVLREILEEERRRA